MLFCIMLNCFFLTVSFSCWAFTWRSRYAQLVCSTNVCCNKFILKLFGSGVDCMLQCLTRQATGIALIILAYKNMEPTPRSLPFGNTNQFTLRDHTYSSSSQSVSLSGCVVEELSFRVLLALCHFMWICTVSIF